MNDETATLTPAREKSENRTDTISKPETSEIDSSSSSAQTSISSTASSQSDTPAAGRARASRQRNPMLNTDIALSERLDMTRIISNRLFLALFSLMAISAIGGYLTWSGHFLSAGATNWMVMLCGAIGGFISLQRRLKKLEDDDLLLLARSWVYVLLSPLVGGILALLLYFLFISGLLEGDLFPNFATSGTFETVATSSTSVAPRTGLSMLFQVHGVDYKDYAKLVFWCFLAGYSESFVTNIISQFESTSEKTR